MTRMISKFRARVMDDLTEMEKTVDAGNAETLAKQSHRLKGAAANLSAERLRSEAAALESFAKADDLAGFAACLTKVQREAERFVQQTSSIANTTQNPEEIRE